MVNLEINVPTDFSKTQKISRFWGKEIDFNFFLDIVSKDKCLEYNGYYYCLSNDQGLSVRPKTKIIHIPLLDMVPANPTTQVKKLSFEHGQRSCIFTCDQQLYYIAASILWHNTELAKYFFLRLGWMHFLMSYIGSIGIFMAGTGMKKIIEKAFVGVSKMLTGKKCPQNLKALPMLMEKYWRHC